MAFDVKTIDPDYEKSDYFPNRKLGLIALSSDHLIEDDIRKMLQGQEINILTNRITFDGMVTPDNLAAMAEDLARVTNNILPDKEIDVVIYGCSSGTVAIGESQLEAEIQQIKPTAKVTNPVTAATAAFKALGVKRLSLLTPYRWDVNENMGQFFQGKGFEILNVAGFGVEEDAEITRIDPAAIVKRAKEILHPEAEALFLSCTAMRAINVIEQLEEALSIPVISSNQAITWHALRLMSVSESVQGYGRLLRL